ncbi:MAG: TlpA family protein disulfide reductase [Anaerolineae bacterium]|nr:TlpA family protein disulfide reductase [Anaerolineae bacterium]
MTELPDQPSPVTPPATTSDAPARLSPALVLFIILPLVGLIAAFIVASGRGSSTTITQQQPPPVTYIPYTLINNPAPDFTLNTLDGKTISLSDLRGKWVFLNFWATWCPPCVEEMPELQKLHDGGYDTDPSQIVVLAVDKAEDKAQIEKFMTANNLSLPVAMDSDNVVSGKYVVVNLPITYIIDPQGMVRAQHISPLTAEIIPLFLDRIKQNKFS